MSLMCGGSFEAGSELMGGGNVVVEMKVELIPFRNNVVGAVS